MSDPAVAELFAQFAQISGRVPTLRDTAIRELVAEFAVTTIRDADLAVNDAELETAMDAYDRVSESPAGECPEWFENQMRAALVAVFKMRQEASRG